MEVGIGLEEVLHQFTIPSKPLLVLIYWMLTFQILESVIAISSILVLKNKKIKH